MKKLLTILFFIIYTYFVSFSMDKKYDWVIYKIVSPSGNIYIGKTSNFTKRMSYYKCYNIKQPKLLASLKKYGYAAHNVSIIERFNETCNYSDCKEMFWIRSYMSNCIKYRDQNGLNLTDGGQGTIGYKATDEVIKKLSESHKGLPSGRKGKKNSEEHVNKVKEFYKKNPSLSRKGYKQTEETKQKIAATKLLRYPKKIKIRPTKEETRLRMSLAKKGKPAWNKGIPMKQSQIELLRKINAGRASWNKGKKFEGTDEERKIKFGSHNIGNTHNRGRKHSDETKLKGRNRLLSKPIQIHRPVLQYDLNMRLISEFDSVKNASASTGVSAWTIGDIAKGNRKTIPDKYIFKYKK